MSPESAVNQNVWAFFVKWDRLLWASPEDSCCSWILGNFVVGENGRKGWKKNPLFTLGMCSPFVLPKLQQENRGYQDQQRAGHNPSWRIWEEAWSCHVAWDGFPGNMGYDSNFTVFFETLIGPFIFILVAWVSCCIIPSGLCCRCWSWWSRFLIPSYQGFVYNLLVP